MSVDFYLVCHDCRKRIHIAQDGLSGWTFYSGERNCMKQLSAWFAEHTLEYPSHKFTLENEHAASRDEYPEIEWSPNHTSTP